MRRPIWHLTEIIRQILKVDQDTELQEIYAEVRERIPLTREQREIAYCVPNYQNCIRGALSALLMKGEAIRVRRATYRKAPGVSAKE